MGRLPWITGLILEAFLILHPSISRGEEGTHDPLPGTEPLLWEDDIASRLVAGVDGFLLEEIEASVALRARHWKREKTSWQAYEKSLEPNRASLARRLGLRDARPPFEAPELVGTTAEPALIGRGARFEAFAVRWPALDGVHGEGVLLVPLEGRAVADVVAIPSADLTPEEIAGLVERLPPASQYARRLAESGCRVLIPMIVSRATGEASWYTRRHGLNHREYLYRPAFELGRHIIGYELQKVLAAVDWFARQGGGSAKIGVMGWGDGGLLALHAAALDARIDAACVSGYFHPLEDTWMEPIDRNVFGLLDEFGGAELASMVAPRTLVIEASQSPEFVLPPGTGGAPGRLATPRLEDVRRELDRARTLVPQLEPAAALRLVASGEDGRGPPGSAEALEALLDDLSRGAKLAPLGAAPQLLSRKLDPESRLRAQILEIDRHTQRVLQESPYVRAELFKGVDTSSLEAYEKTIEAHRERFRDDVIGRFDRELLPAHARSRKFEETAEWTSYEVVLDVFPGVIAYGLLLLPRGVDAGEPRPVVVCQHGLEGRPQHVIGQEGSQYYAAFAARLAERGFITFAPQNLYIFGDRFRTLQRKANLLQKTLFSIIVPQHQQIVNWLKSLPGVDPSRIAFYGLSYGGKSAMRIPALVKEYCLSICSGDFNEWVWKNASTRSPYSYVWTGEYEIFEFDLGSTFNYAEMASLIAPRPFMVERGHFDGVAPDETVGHEFAKVRFLYEAKLGIGERCELEWFTGPHTIHGQGTFEFLHRHLKWPKRS